MKRLLILVLALTLCFAGCKEEPKMPDTPEVKHTEEVKAPIEETPEEPDGIEPTEEPDENVIILPEPDENTKVITIEFPEDFPEEPYTEPELVSPEEFEWGEYVPFVRYNDYFFNSDNTPNYAILSPKAPTLEEGKALYSLINEKIFETLSDKNYLFDSNVVYISEEFDFSGSVGIKQDTNGKYYSEYNIISKNEVVCTLKKFDIKFDEFTLGGYYSYWEPISKYYLNSNSIKYPDDISLSVFSPNTKTMIFYEENNKNTYYFYDILKSRIALHLTLQNNSFGTTIRGNNCSKFLINYGKTTENEYIDNLYLYDIETQKPTYLGNYMYNASLSPDGKYVFYTTPAEEDLPDSSCKNATTLYESERSGFFIKNLQNNETVFYEVNDSWNTLGIIEWVNQENLTKAIKS